MRAGYRVRAAVHISAATSGLDLITRLAKKAAHQRKVAHRPGKRIAASLRHRLIAVQQRHVWRVLRIAGNTDMRKLRSQCALQRVEPTYLLFATQHAGKLRAPATEGADAVEFHCERIHCDARRGLSGAAYQRWRQTTGVIAQMMQGHMQPFARKWLAFRVPALQQAVGNPRRLLGRGRIGHHRKKQAFSGLLIPKPKRQLRLGRR